MHPALYRDLVPWYRLLDPFEDHADEAVAFRAAFERVITPPAQTLFEIGSGAGNNAVHLKVHFRCTLSDLSEDMLALSRELNPECEHLADDMRTLRLGRTFDAVLMHDAIAYMTTEADLAAAVETAFVHTRPGGAAILAPDCLRETFREDTELHRGESGSRSLRCLAWTWDPDPADDTYCVDYSFLLRDGQDMKAVHDRHVEGLFSRTTWLRILTNVGFHVENIDRPLGEDRFDEVFLCRRPT